MLHEVITSEKVPFTFKVAGVGSRFLATLVDLGILALLLVLGAFVAIVLNITRAGLGSGVFSLWVFALMCCYFVLFEWLWLGQTPGKRMLGIRVIQWDGANITFAQSALRNLLRFVDILPGFYGVAFLTAMCNREQRRLGDLAADTLVVHLQTSARLLFIFAPSTSSADQERHALLQRQREQLSREQKKAILDLCLRRDQLRFRARARLFNTLATYYATEKNLKPGDYESDEKFILQLVAVLNSGER